MYFLNALLHLQKEKEIISLKKVNSLLPIILINNKKCMVPFLKKLYLYFLAFRHF